jgi:hypothetical protein
MTSSDGQAPSARRISFVICDLKKKAWFLIAKISSTEITRPEENAYDTNPSNHRSNMFSSNPHTIARNGHVQVPGPAETSKTTERHQSTKNI